MAIFQLKNDLAIKEKHKIICNIHKANSRYLYTTIASYPYSE